MSELLRTLSDRGFVHEATPGLADRLARGPITGYVGFDPTASSLHVGSLIPVMGLAWLQRAGGTPIVLIGGGTALVGDPSGKRAERPMLGLEEIEANCRGVRAQLERFLDFSGPAAARLLNNADWLRPLALLDFLRDIGKHFTLGYMLQKESVRSRLETGLSFTEFSYMLVQAFDFLHLYREERCELQMGGSDQWGNITAGIELIHRRDGAQAHGLVFPLLTTASGAKFGKTEEGNIWLDPGRTSPYRFYQFWLNAEDTDVERHLRFFTFRSLEEIAGVMTAQAAAPGRREAQRLLAADVTAMVHGREVLERVIRASGILFGGAAGDDLDVATLAVVAAEVPGARIEVGRLAGFSVVDALVLAGLAQSKGEARRGIEGRGFSVNGVPIESPDRELGPGDLRGGRYVLLRKGKKSYAMLEVAER